MAVTGPNCGWGPSSRARGSTARAKYWAGEPVSSSEAVPLLAVADAVVATELAELLGGAGVAVFRRVRGTFFLLHGFRAFPGGVLTEALAFAFLVAVRASRGHEATFAGLFWARHRLGTFGIVAFSATEPTLTVVATRARSAAAGGAAVSGAAAAAGAVSTAAGAVSTAACRGAATRRAAAASAIRHATTAASCSKNGPNGGQHDDAKCASFRKPKHMSFGHVALVPVARTARQKKKTPPGPWFTSVRGP